MGSKALAFVALLALAGCNQTVGLTSSFCDPKSGIRPIHLRASEREALYPDTKRNLLAILQYGADNCGWSAKGN